MDKDEGKQQRRLHHQTEHRKSPQKNKKSIIEAERPIEPCHIKAKLPRACCRIDHLYASRTSPINRRNAKVAISARTASRYRRASIPRRSGGRGCTGRNSVCLPFPATARSSPPA